MMTVYPGTLLVIAVLFCLMFFAVRINTKTAEPTSKNIFQDFKNPLSQRGWSLKLGGR